LGLVLIKAERVNFLGMVQVREQLIVYTLCKIYTMMKLLCSFIISKGVSAVNYDPNRPDPLNEPDFLTVMEQVNNMNSSSSEFPIRLSWDDYSAYALEKNTLYAMDYLKDTRNKLLQSSDWVMTQDNYQTITNIADWVTYRQTLRDFFNPPFVVILTPSGDPDYVAMGFPPKQPPVIRANA